MAFLTVNNSLKCVFKNTDQKNICASIVFKAESKSKPEEHFFWGGFLQKTKTHFGGSKIVAFETQIWDFFLRLFLNVKGSFMPIITLKY